MTTPMQAPEHADAAREFYTDATGTIAAGKDLVAAQILWGSVVHTSSAGRINRDRVVASLSSAPPA
jgi:hypothetical protein